jgi:pantetheine-phosphate adenylyltransferase
MSQTSTSNRIAVFPGTFDPITLGHMDLIRRGSRLYEQLIVGVGENPEKLSLLKASERMEIVRHAVGELGNVRVESYTGLTVDFARGCGAGVLLRGIRDAADLHVETAIAHTNRQVSGVETVFMLPAPQYAFISSRLVRQIAQAGGDVSGLVPPEVLAHLAKRS